MSNPALKLLKATLEMQGKIDEELWLDAVRSALAAIVEEMPRLQVMALAEYVYNRGVATAVNDR